jgi:hypothetical protein
MKKLHSNGHALIQTESTLSFASFSKEENQTNYYQYNGEYSKEISKESYVESNFYEKWKKISYQLSNSNFSYIESIAKCWIKEDGNSKLISLKEYYNNTFGANWEKDYEFDIIPNNLFSNVTNFMTCTIQNEMVCLLWPHDIILHFNEHDELVQYISLEAADYCDTLYHICSDGQAIWGVSPTLNTVVKYTFPSFKIEKIYHYTTDESLAQKQREKNNELHVIFSENELTGLNYPEYISYIDGQLYICDTANKRIVIFNPKNGKITPHISLNSKPSEFLKWKNQFVIQSDTGIYLLNENEKKDFFD